MIDSTRCWQPEGVTPEAGGWSSADGRQPGKRSLPNRAVDHRPWAGDQVSVTHPTAGERTGPGRSPWRYRAQSDASDLLGDLFPKEAPMPGETRMEPPMSAPPSADLRLAQAPRTYPTRWHDSLARQLGASLCLPGPSGSQPFSQEPFSDREPEARAAC